MTATDTMVEIHTDLSLAKTLFVEDTIYTSNIEITGDLRVLGKVSAIDTQTCVAGTVWLPLTLT